MSKVMILRPRMSEKTYGQSQALNVYTFDVPAEANKHSVARAVATQFDVTVKSVNIVNVKGKAKRTISRGGRRVANGSQSDVKKAFVTLTEGQTIPIFAAVEEEEQKAEKRAEQMAKAVEKAEKKAAKKEKK